MPPLLRLAPLLLLVACESGSSTRSAPSREAPSATLQPQLAPYEPLLQGRWRMKMQNGLSQFDHWHIGPGGHSALRTTSGFGGDRMPWRALLVAYRQPANESLRLLGLSPFLSGVSTGSIEFVDGAIESSFTLSQSGGETRSMRARLTFDGEDRFLSALTEDSLQGDSVLLGEWRYTREAAIDGEGERTSSASVRWEPIEPLLDKAWRSIGESPQGAPREILSRFEVVPHADYVHLRTNRISEGRHQLDHEALCYFDPSSESLRYLALWSSGAVDEGEITLPDRGTMRVEFSRSRQDGSEARTVQWSVREDGMLERHEWTRRAGEATLVEETLFEERGARK